MARAGLDRAAVIDAGAALVDRDGLEGLTLARLAVELGIRSPSLYAHIGGLDDLRRQLHARAAGQLTEALQGATVGVAGAAALEALATAYRAWAKAHPGLYAALQPADHQDEEAAARLVGIVLAVLAGYGIDGDEAIHQTRAIRAALHGFIVLETGGGFGIDLDVGESFRRLVGVLESGLAAAAGLAGRRQG
jgi:AcrR family transcriptional regulator